VMETKLDGEADEASNQSPQSPSLALCSNVSWCTA
jgi:hypothetical protein